MSRNSTPVNFTVERFGWLNRWWKQNDHLVVLGYNCASCKYFTLARRQVRDLLRLADLPMSEWHSLIARAQVAVDVLRISTRRTIRYEGSLLVSQTAKSHRHFVFVEISEILTDDHLQDYYHEFDKNEVVRIFAHNEVETVNHIINRQVFVGSTACVA